MPGATSQPGSVEHADRVGRVGVMYVRGLLAQAGIRNNEESPGEDYGAVDLTVHLPSAAVTAQVKTSMAARRNQDGTYSVDVTDKWCSKWREQKVPVYLILVVLSKRDFCALVHIGERSTTWHAHAYWVQVNDATAGVVRVPVQNRLSLSTFERWANDVTQVFSIGAVS